MRHGSFGIFINTADDMRWLREAHLPQLSKQYRSAVLVGNEDSPDEIYVYRKHDPSINDTPTVFRQSRDGSRYYRVRVKRY